MRIACCWSAAMLVLAASAAPTACAQNYPARPIRLIVPQAAGGSNDIMARYIGNYLTERFGRQVVVDNRPGADGMIGTEIATFLKMPETQKRFTNDGAEVDIRTPAEMRRMIPVDMAKWAKVAREAGMRAE